MTNERDEWRQIRHAAIVIWPRELLSYTQAECVRLGSSLSDIGYDGCIANMHYDSIIQAWYKSGWIEYSPDGFHVRITPKGREQFATWLEEDRLWRTGSTEAMPLQKRLVAGEPAQNIRKIKNLIATSTVVGIYDPYTRAGSLDTLLRLAELETKFSPSLRLLGTPILRRTELLPLKSSLSDINTEKKTTWQIRTYTDVSKPHRRFMVLDDGSSLTCGMSFNHINKDEAIDRDVAGSENAKHDFQFFEDKWKLGTPI